MSEAFARPFRPVELTASTLTSFPLQAMAQQLMTEATFQTSGRNALTLIHHQTFTVVLTVLKAGAVLDEHHAPAPVPAAAVIWRDHARISSGDNPSHT